VTTDRCDDGGAERPQPAVQEFMQELLQEEGFARRLLNGTSDSTPLASTNLEFVAPIRDNAELVRARRTSR
jgi:hypothetical protein